MTFDVELVRKGLRRRYYESSLEPTYNAIRMRLVIRVNNTNLYFFICQHVFVLSWVTDHTGYQDQFNKCLID